MQPDRLEVRYPGQLYRRMPRVDGTVDVWDGDTRHIYLEPLGGHSTRWQWREAVARQILGPLAAAADITGRGGVYETAKPRSRAEYGGTRYHSHRLPGASPVVIPGLAVHVDNMPPDDARRAHGVPVGRVLAFDKATGVVWVYRAKDKPWCGWRAAFKVVFALNNGPLVRVTGRAPLYIVDARQWTEQEIKLCASVGAKGRWAAKKRAGGSPWLEARATKKEEARVSGKARERIRVAKQECDRLRIMLRDAGASAIRWPGAERDAKVEALRVWALRVYSEYAGAVARDGALVRGARAVATPALLPDWAGVPWKGRV